MNSYGYGSLGVIAAVNKVDPVKYVEFIETCKALIIPDMSEYHRVQVIEGVAQVDPAKYVAFIETCNALVTPGMDGYDRGCVILGVAKVDPAQYQVFIQTCNDLSPNMDSEHRAYGIATVAMLPESLWQFMVQFIGQNPNFFRYVPSDEFWVLIDLNPPQTLENLMRILNRLHQDYHRNAPVGIAVNK